jgi:hypothetical protein
MGGRDLLEFKTNTLGSFVERLWKKSLDVFPAFRLFFLPLSFLLLCQCCHHRRHPRRLTCFCIVLITPSTLVFRELASPYTSTRLTPHSLIPPTTYYLYRTLVYLPYFRLSRVLLFSHRPCLGTGLHITFFTSSNQLLLHLYKKK